MGKFEEGQSGNPSGRPPGITDKRAGLRKLLDPHSEELVAKVVEMALSGDSVAMRLCFERLIPSYKNVDQSVVLEALKNANGLSEQAQSVINAIANGELSAGDGGAFIRALSQMVKIKEFEELEQRITALENKRET
jgi:polyhydroxyalkanoate synthesis regulator phasin